MLILKSDREQVALLSSQVTLAFHFIGSMQFLLLFVCCSLLFVAVVDNGRTMAVARCDPRLSPLNPLQLKLMGRAQLENAVFLVAFMPPLPERQR